MIGIYSYGMACRAVSMAEYRARQRRAEMKEKRRERMKRQIASNVDAAEEAALDGIEAQLFEDNHHKSQICCPECGRRCIVVVVDGVEIDCCLRCKGYWFEPGELKDLSREARDIPGDNLQHRRSKYKCPVCGRKMAEHVFRRHHNLLVDRCPDHHGVYLESGELERVFTMSPARKGGNRRN